eukprot:1352162-Alexandrium_andersonii.AAC.1
MRLGLRGRSDNLEAELAGLCPAPPESWGRCRLRRGALGLRAHVVRPACQEARAFPLFSRE